MAKSYTFGLFATQPKRIGDPDILADMFLRARGEFSAVAEMKYEKQLKILQKIKNKFSLTKGGDVDTE